MTPVFVVTVGDIVGGVVAILVVLAIAAIWIPMWWREWLCKHDGGVTETRSCDAICRKCGKNLGFIGSLKNRGMP